VWHVAAGGGDTLDIGLYVFPDNNDGDYVEFVSDGATTWYVRSVYP
jgi:hypothetical protein